MSVFAGFCGSVSPGLQGLGGNLSHSLAASVRLLHPSRLDAFHPTDCTLAPGRST